MALVNVNDFKLDRPTPDFRKRYLPSPAREIVDVISNRDGKVRGVNKALIIEIIQDFILGGKGPNGRVKNLDGTDHTDKKHLVRMQGGVTFLVDDTDLAALSA